MADAYKIIIKTQGGGSSAPKNPIAGDNNESKETQSKKKEKPADVKAYVAFKKYVAPFVKQNLQHQISTVELRTGNSERQARMQSAYNIASQIFGIAESIFIGGSVGGVPGMIVGAVMSIATTAIDYAQQQNTINLQHNLENQTISMFNVRSGAINGNRR